MKEKDNKRRISFMKNNLYQLITTSNKKIFFLFYFNKNKSFLVNKKFE